MCAVAPREAGWLKWNVENFPKPYPKPRNSLSMQRSPETEMLPGFKTKVCSALRQCTCAGESVSKNQGSKKITSKITSTRLRVESLEP